MEQLAPVLARIPNVVAVTLGGSRATGTARADPDWDFGLHYRDPIDPVACAGNLAVAALSAAHAVLCERGEWYLNAKDLQARAGFGELDGSCATSAPTWPARCSASQPRSPLATSDAAGRRTRR